MNKYYKLDSTKVTYGEYWNIVRSWKVIIPWTAKLLNVPMKFSAGLPAFESVRELEVPAAEFSEQARGKLRALLEKCQRMGFHSPRYFTYESMRRDARTSFIALLHSSGATVRLMHTMSVKVQPPIEKVLVVLLSELRDGTYLVTSSQRQQFLPAPGITVNRLLGAGPEQLLESHLQKLRELPMNNSAKSVTSVEMLDEVWDRYERKAREFGMQRGIYVWMTPEEVTAEQGTIAEAKAMAGDNDQDMEVMLEINQLRNKQSGWGGIIILFVVSLLLFIGAGARSWSWDYLIILLGVLFVHELGHYVAMRAFHYRNVRMFFIPFFGAAVSGQHYNVAGWKKVVVSLMGPLPGIALGIIIGAAGIVLHKAVLLKIGVVSLLLNGSNLIPVLPLDGGWVFHTLLFSRHYVLDTVFRVLAALVLIASVTFLRTKLLMYLGILMLVGIPAAYRMARIAVDLKKRDLPPISEDDQTIPPATAQAIIGEVKRTATRPLPTRIIAQQTLQIFETLNARPPGWGATLGLLFAHATGFALAAVFGLAFIIAQRSELRDLFANAALIPKHQLSVKPWPVWNGNEVVLRPDNITLVATFVRAGEASEQFQGWTNRLPTTAALSCFGESVLLSLPAAQDDLRKQWLAEFQRQTRDVFVDSTNYHAAFSLMCIAPDTNAAQGIVNEINGYLTTLPDQGLVPPWQPNDTRTSMERVRNDLARQTYLKLQGEQSEIYDDSRLQELERGLETARTHGDTPALIQLRTQIKSTAERLTKEKMQQLRSGAEGPVDTNVVDLFIALNTAETSTNQTTGNKIRQELAQCMGQLLLEKGEVVQSSAQCDARNGIATSKGLIINVMMVSFQNINAGPPALANWLSAKRCIGFRYEFQPGLATDAESSD
jgi:Zn-dependent protease